MSRVLAAAAAVLMFGILALVILMSCGFVAASIWGVFSLFVLSVLAGVLADLSNRSLSSSVSS